MCGDWGFSESIGGKMPPELSTRTDPFNIVVDFEQALRCLLSQLLVFKAEEGKWDEERPKKGDLL